MSDLHHRFLQEEDDQFGGGGEPFDYTIPQWSPMRVAGLILLVLTVTSYGALHHFSRKRRRREVLHKTLDDDDEENPLPPGAMKDVIVAVPTTTTMRTPSPLLLPFDDPENRSTDCFDAAAAAAAHDDEQLLEGASFSRMCGKDAVSPRIAAESLGMFTALSNLQKTLSGAFLWQQQQRTASEDFPDSDPVVGIFKQHPYDEETLGAPMDDDYDGTSNNRAAALEQQGAILTTSAHHSLDEIPINNSFDSTSTPEAQEVVFGEEAGLAIPFDILGVKTNAEAAAPAPLFLRRQTRYGD